MKRLAWFPVVVLALPLGCAFSFERGDDLEPGTVRGRAVDSAGAGVPFAQLALIGTPHAARAQADGNFSKTALESGSYAVRVFEDTDGDGISERGAVRAFTLREGAGLLLGDVELADALTYQGRVEDAAGAPVGGARVSVFRRLEIEDARFDGPVELTVASDADGRFTLPGVIPGETFAFAEREGVSGAVALGDEDEEVVLIVADARRAGPSVELEVRPPFEGEAVVSTTLLATGAAVSSTLRFTAGRVTLEGLDAGAYDVRVCSRASGCEVPNPQDAFAPALPLPEDGALGRWGPVFFQECTDCDSDGSARFDAPSPSEIAACADACRAVYEDPGATCELDGEVLDCDDDGDGQPDILEPAACRDQGAGGDRDSDGLCDREDPFPDCATNDDDCLTPGAHPPGGAGPPGRDDVDECVVGIADCGPLAECVNDALSFSCVCVDGFELVSGACEDVDECAAPDACPAGERCINEAGAFRCELDGCAGDPCGADDPCAPGADGAFTCTCGDGSTVDDAPCNDCLVDPTLCGDNGTCAQDGAAFTCACDGGYALNGAGDDCLDIDECGAPEDNNCDANAQCTNQDGGFSCACNAGFTGDGTACADINECEATPDLCGANAACTNLAGSFRCDCLPGFADLGDGCVVDGSVDACDPGFAGAGVFGDELEVSDGVNGLALDAYGISTALSFDGNTLAFGAQDNVVSSPDDGTVSVFFDAGAGPALQQEVFSSVAPAGAQHGTAISLSDDGDTLVSGGITDAESGARAGAARIYGRAGGAWSELEVLAPNDIVAGDQFGIQVELSGAGDLLVVGAAQQGSAGTGAAYVFELDVNGFVFVERLTAPDGAAGDSFGEALALSSDGTRLVVGARDAAHDAGQGPVARAGAAYVFERSAGAFGFVAKLVSPEPQATALFGEDVTLTDDGAVFVGAPLFDGALANEGAVYRFEDRGAGYVYVRKLAPRAPQANGRLGQSLDVTPDGAFLIAGALLTDGHGAAFVYQDQGGLCDSQQLSPSDGVGDRDEYGFSVAISGNGARATVGARVGDGAVTDAGSGYIYRFTPN